MPPKNSPKLRSFPPIIDDRSRILILGTMPGPEALRKREYYGFKGNHFWKIIPDVLGLPRPQEYRDKISLLKENRIAIWDVVKTCRRAGAADSAMRGIVPTRLLPLVKKYPGLQAIFLNGKMAEGLYKKLYGEKIHVPAHTLPSTSPAHASMSYAAKLEKWMVIKKYLGNVNPWC